MSSRHAKKRKREVDTSTEADDRLPEHSNRRETRRSSRRHEREETSPSKSLRVRDHNVDDDATVDAGTKTLSIDETNKLRAELGLAPLDIDDGLSAAAAAAAAAAANKPDIVLGEGESLFTEDGVSIVHKAARNLTSEKVSNKVKERLETAKQKRQVESKVLKVRRGLADSDSDGDESASAWVRRNREMEEARRKAEEKAKELDELDETFGVSGLIEKEQQRRVPSVKLLNASLTSGLIVGHSKDTFAETQETVLVLQDKDVLDEDEDEVLVNPNLLENERHKRNVELRKKKGSTGYNPYEAAEIVDEFGEVTKKQILDKYDDVLNGDEQPKHKKFRLDETGGYDLDKETREAEMRRKLIMANKRSETLETARPALAREFYTEEEMISFRRPKKKKDTNKMRKRKTLKVCDLQLENDEEVVDETPEERRLRAEKLAARRGEAPLSAISEAAEAAPAAVNGDSKALEDGELADDGEPTAPKRSKWKEASGAIVDVAKLREVAERRTSPSKRRSKRTESSIKEEPADEKSSPKKKAIEENDDDEESSDDENFVGGVSLTGVVLEDDAEDEFRFALERNRRLRQVVKTEVREEDGEAPNVDHLTGVERIRALLAAAKAKNERVDLDTEDIEEEEVGCRKIVFDATSEQYKTIGEIPTLGLAGNREDGVDYSNLLVDDEKDLAAKKKKKGDEERRKRDEEDYSVDLDELANLPLSSHDKEDSDENDAQQRTYENVLGEEKDVSKGVAAMLKLAGVKGYLESGVGRRTGDGTLKHLESKRFSRVEQGRYDIEDKTMRKLERMGTTGTGPVRSFPEMADYKPDVEISYSDSKGRVMSEKEAFRELSWKFHGKGPGKKQIEKHQAKLEKKERLKKMNSMDTPLGTLAKQRRKQEQLQTPYLILSGTGKDGAPLQKD